MKKLLALACLLCLAGGLRADEPFQASVTPDVAIYSSTETISGLTLSIWGQNPQHSLAIGFVNGTSGDSSGLSIGLVNYGDHYTGVQWGIVNFDNREFLGWQVGGVNFTAGTMTGFQLGWVNYANALNGFQLGFVNAASTVPAGLQIGVLNIMLQNEWFTELPDALAPAMIFVNWRF